MTNYKTQTILYGGTVILDFEPYRHLYTKDGKQVLNVTNITKVIDKPKLIGWAVGVAVDHLKGCIMPGQKYDELELNQFFTNAQKAHYQKKVDAGDLGTFVHEWVENYIKGNRPAMPINEQLKTAIKKFLSWEEKYKVKFLASEQKVYSKKYNYTGTLDFICEIDGELYIGDLKTSSGIYPEHLLQTAAYRFAREEEFQDEKYIGQVIVRVGKTDGDLQIFFVRDFEKYKTTLTAFLAALKLKESLDLIENYKPDNVEIEEGGENL